MTHNIETSPIVQVNVEDGKPKVKPSTILVGNDGAYIKLQSWRIEQCEANKQKEGDQS